MTARDTPHNTASSASEGQRWRAAQRLAQGDSIHQAAGWADLPSATIEGLRGEAGFQEQIRSEVDLLAMSDEAWAERLKGQVRQAVERALAEGKVSTVNLLLRTSFALPALAKGGPAGRAAAAAVLAGAAEPAAPPATTHQPGPPDAVPPVEPDPEREARRLAILAGIKPVLRPDLTGAGLDLLEQYAAATDPDPAAYETWFAAQPKPVFPALTLPPEDQAAIRHVTRHNPPWLRGDYLGYYRPPVPRDAFAQDAAGTVATRAEPAAAEPAPAPVAAPEPLPALQARLARLFDRSAPREAEELDLAEAVCAVRWPNWPRYAGPTDLALLRRALADRRIDDDTLHWLGSHELAQACRGAAARDPPATG